MQFRPCIDIHNGSVKQIVGSSLRDHGDFAAENFVSAQDAVFYTELYAAQGFSGGHMILLNPVSSPYYEASRDLALAGLKAAPGKWQIGGGITPELAGTFLDAGASHVIVTSYVFREGRIDYDRLEEMVRAAGKEHLVLDLSCRRVGEDYVIVTDRWQKLTDTKLTEELLDLLSDKCDEFLVHATDVEGKQAGIEEHVASLLGNWGKRPVTYAGGVHSMEDLRKLKELGKERVDVTVGSALEIFGGSMTLEEIRSML